MTIGVTVDCRDPAALAEFWREVLGYELRQRDGAPWRTLVRPSASDGVNHVHFQPVPESKTVKNRVHLDLFVDDLEREVARHVALGATADAHTAGSYRQRNAVMFDPEDNEYCIVERRPRSSAS